jgi:hypothetical protein
MAPNLNLTASILFVDENGSLLEKARLLHILLKEKPAKVVYEKLLSLQNSDGGFPSRPKAGSPSSVDSTLTAIWQLDELGMFESAPVRRALNFLVSLQRAYGGWDENARLPAHDLPPWIRPGETATRLYLSTYAAYWLGLAGPEYRAPLQTAAAFLEAWQGQEGGQIDNAAQTSRIARRGTSALKRSADGSTATGAEPLSPGQLPGYLHNNWLGTSAFLLAGSDYMRNARLGLDYLQAHPLADFEDSQIAWALDCLSRAGLSAAHPFIQAGLDALRQRRAPDGSWASEDGPSSAASATVSVIKVLSRLSSS